MLLFWSMSNTLSMFLLNFLGSVCYFGCLFCLCMSTSSHVSGVLNIVVLFSMRMCLFGWLSTTTQSRLLSMTIERRGGCGAGELGYLAAFPASLCPVLATLLLLLSARRAGEHRSWTWWLYTLLTPMSIQRSRGTFCFSTLFCIVNVMILRLPVRHDQSLVRVRRARCCSHFKGGSMARTGF